MCCVSLASILMLCTAAMLCLHMLKIEGIVVIQDQSSRTGWCGQQHAPMGGGSTGSRKRLGNDFKVL